MKGPAHDTQKWTESRHTYILEVSEDQILKKSVKEIKSYRQNIFLFKQLSLTSYDCNKFHLFPKKKLRKLYCCLQVHVFRQSYMLYSKCYSDKC